MQLAPAAVCPTSLRIMSTWTAADCLLSSRCHQSELPPIPSGARRVNCTTRRTPRYGSPDALVGECRNPNAQPTKPPHRNDTTPDRGSPPTTSALSFAKSPFSWCIPRSSNSRPDPITRSRSVLDTSTSFASVSALTRAPMCTPMPPISSPRISHSPVCNPARTPSPAEADLWLVA